MLKAWSGLGYNRRARYLHEAAKNIVSKVEPWNAEILVNNRGIGANTAAAVCGELENEGLISSTDGSFALG